VGVGAKDGRCASEAKRKKLSQRLLQQMRAMSPLPSRTRSPMHSLARACSEVERSFVVHAAGRRYCLTSV
jgi:hypothetical protein